MLLEKETAIGNSLIYMKNKYLDTKIMKLAIYLANEFQF